MGLCNAGSYDRRGFARPHAHRTGPVSVHNSTHAGQDAQRLMTVADMETSWSVKPT